jgi:tetratricopeptide (TPR) repeat protein
VSRHAHNDFLEIGADIGIPGALGYLSLFLICGWFLVKIIRTARTPGEGLLFAAPFAAMVAYAVDATFNFPLERANMQMLFALALALNVVNYRHNFPAKEHMNTGRPVFMAIVTAMLLISSGALFVSWKVLVSMRGQFLIRNELASSYKGSRHSYDEIAPYFSAAIPNITETGIPVAYIRAKYLVDEKRYDEAAAIITADKNSNPYLPDGDLLLGFIHEQKGNLDAAYGHYRHANELGHKDYASYASLQKICILRKDSVALERNFREAEALYPGYEKWTHIAQWTVQLNGNVTKALAYLAEGARQFPANNAILFNIHYLKAYDLLRREQFQQSVAEGIKALQYNSSYPAIQNLGLAYLGMGDHFNASATFGLAIVRYGQGNGEPAYFRGQCLLALGDKAGACADFAAAKKQGYAVEAEYLAVCK